MTGSDDGKGTPSGFRKPGKLAERWNQKKQQAPTAVSVAVFASGF
jgi:hypothetical protein